jgi:hypothetical protein
MLIGMLGHLHRSILHIMKKHEWLDMYNAIWLSRYAYQDLTPKTKSYEEVSPWKGQEMKEISRYLDGVVTRSLRG